MDERVTLVPEDQLVGLEVEFRSCSPVIDWERSIRAGQGRQMSSLLETFPTFLRAFRVVRPCVLKESSSRWVKIPLEHLAFINYHTGPF